MESDAPTPTHAEKARTMLRRLPSGALSTMHAELGYPYASTINLAVDDATGQPFTVGRGRCSWRPPHVTTAGSPPIMPPTQSTLLKYARVL